MNKYAIIKMGPFQFNVEEGKEVTVPKFEGEVGQKIEISEVLAIGENEKITLGNPYVSNSKVVLEIIDQGKGEKVVSQIYKAKSRYNKKVGHRKLITKFKVISIK
jgi:large subunit ribosomal protein L21